MAECGTNAGFQAHRKLHEKPCEACRAANRDYQRDWKAKPGNQDKVTGYKNHHKIRAELRERVLERLAREYPERFMELYDEEAAASHATVVPFQH